MCLKTCTRACTLRLSESCEIECILNPFSTDFWVGTRVHVSLRDPSNRDLPDKKQTSHRANKHAIRSSHTIVDGVRGRDLDLRGNNEAFTHHLTSASASDRCRCAHDPHGNHGSALQWRTCKAIECDANTRERQPIKNTTTVDARADTRVGVIQENSSAGFCECLHHALPGPRSHRTCRLVVSGWPNVQSNRMPSGET